MTTLLIEPFGGLAGDMLLAALLDLRRAEVSLELLQGLATALVGEECSLASTEVRRRGLRATHLAVKTSETDRPPHRRLPDLLALLESIPESLLSTRGRARAATVLRRLGEAEAQVHGIGLDEVHFHEVGAVDTIVDVAGAVLAIERLGCERVLCTEPYVGGGTVRCAHGEMPVPAPATLELLGARAFRRGPGGERLTPTAAALLDVLAAPLAAGAMVEGADAERVAGYGAGTRDPEDGPPNLCRVTLVREGRERGSSAGRVVWLGAANLDDATGEEVAFLAERLRAAGALDVWTQGAGMKKGRLGVVVSVLAEPLRRDALDRVFFEHSPTLGVRWSVQERTECERSVESFPFEGGSVRIKVRRRPGRPIERSDLSPEYDDLARIAVHAGTALRDLEQRVLDCAVRDEAFLARIGAQDR